MDERLSETEPAGVCNNKRTVSSASEGEKSDMRATLSLKI